MLSGGYDSSVLLVELLDRGFEVHPLYVRSGFYWERAELYWVRKLLRTLKCPALKALTVAEAPMRWTMKGHWSLTGRGAPDYSAPDEHVYLPGRNLVLLSQAGIYCASRGVDNMALAILRGNPFADAKPLFLKAMAVAISRALGCRLSILTPYVALSKAQVARRGRGVPAAMTFSCIKPRGLRPCGRCNKCSERAKTPGLKAARWSWPAPRRPPAARLAHRRADR